MIRIEKGQDNITVLWRAIVRGGNREKEQQQIEV